MSDQFSSQPTSSNSKRDFFDGNPKMIFAFGLMTGALAMAIIFVSGLIPSSVASSDTDPATAAPEQVTTKTAKPAGVLPAVTSKDHVRGDLKQAKVVLIEYSDFECPYCSQMHPNLVQARTEYGDKVAWIYRHFPLSFHPQATPAALASECAGEQGKFWEYADALFENQELLATDYYPTLAATLGLKADKFATCMESKKYASIITADQSGGSTAGVTGTPATFVNGKQINGVVSYATLKQAIEAALAALK